MRRQTRFMSALFTTPTNRGSESGTWVRPDLGGNRPAFALFLRNGSGYPARSENADANAGTDADGRKGRCCAIGSLRPELVLKVGQPEMNAAIEAEVHPAPRRNHQRVSLTKAKCQIGLAEPHKTLGIGLESPIIPEKTDSAQIGRGIDIVCLVKLQPARLRFDAEQPVMVPAAASGSAEEGFGHSRSTTPEEDRPRSLSGRCND